MLCLQTNLLCLTSEQTWVLSDMKLLYSVRSCYHQFTVQNGGGGGGNYPIEMTENCSD